MGIISKSASSSVKLYFNRLNGLMFGSGLICDRGLTLGDLIGVLNDFFSRLGKLFLTFPLNLNFGSCSLERDINTIDVIMLVRDDETAVQASL